MNKKIKQIDFTEALELARKGRKVWVITSIEKPVIKSFNNIPIGTALYEDGNYIFFVFEEADDEI